MQDDSEGARILREGRELQQRERARVDEIMAGEGFRKIPVGEWKKRGEAVFWAWTGGERPGYRRIDGITGAHRPSWSRHFTLYRGADPAGTAKPDEPLYVRSARPR